MKIGFTGPYCTANFGDWAMLVNNIYDFGDNEFFIFTYSDSFPHSAIKHYMGNRIITMVEVQIMDRELSLQNATPLDCLLSIKNMGQLTTIIKELDVLVVSGGGWLNDRWCGRLKHFYRVMAPLLIAAQKGVPVRFMAQGIGPIIETKEMMRGFFNFFGGNTVVAVRDKYCSASYLNEFFSEGIVKFLPDDLSVINEELFESNNAQMYTGGGQQPYFVLITNEKPDLLRNRIGDFSSFCREMKTRYGLDVLLLSFDLVWHGDEQVSLLNANIDGSKSVLIGEKRFLPIGDVISYIKNAEFLITERYHASVVAMQTHTPFFVKLDSGNSVYAYNKAHGVLDEFLKSIEYDERDFLANDWDHLFALVMENYKGIVERQNRIFSEDAYERNCLQMRSIRKNYIAEFIK